MRARPTALAWIDPDVSTAPGWDVAQVKRLARRLGYTLLWPGTTGTIPLLDQVRTADVDALVMPTPAHLDALTLDRIMQLADVETACPRLSFARWAGGGR
ncbi:hypothetical protein [Nocardia vermiculata]|uniref:Uncharacterized protein n=1 Tax=Nocardia vermiculata TaxID=257274 RepID=A0A846Y8T1_9NOCA|nr:hypothetical protein [Nocardia vermiculata]NKY54214.1 hypothetical protein [Nocardia vermiculata]